MELDSHVDTCVLGKDLLKSYNWNCPVNVYRWNPKDRYWLCQKIPGAVDYYHPQSGQVYIFIFRQCILVDHLDHHILCPMQYRINSVEMNKTPKFLLKRPNNTSHAIVMDEPYGETTIIVPLSINGVTIYFPYRKPTRSDFQRCEVPWIDFTAEAPDWDPSDR